MAVGDGEPGSVLQSVRVDMMHRQTVPCSGFRLSDGAFAGRLLDVLLRRKARDRESAQSGAVARVANLRKADKARSPFHDGVLPGERCGGPP